MKSHDGKEVIGWENIELISDRPLEVMLQEFKQLKAEFPDRVLIASIMEEYNRPAVRALCPLLPRWCPPASLLSPCGLPNSCSPAPAALMPCAAPGSQNSPVPARCRSTRVRAVGGADRAVPGGRGGRL